MGRRDACPAAIAAAGGDLTRPMIAAGREINEGHSAAVADDEGAGSRDPAPDFFPTLAEAKV